jgi:hypothetical protein
LQNSFAQQNRPFEAIFIHSPWPAHLGADLVKWNVAASQRLVTGFKIIDFSGQSSFAFASLESVSLGLIFQRLDF